LHAQGVWHARQQSYTKAKGLYDESLELKEKLGDKKGQAVTLCCIAELAYARGDTPVAEGLHRDSQTRINEVDEPLWWARNLYGLGRCAAARADAATARHLFGEARAIAERLNIPLVQEVKEPLQQLDPEPS
jgi:hypothetical protein